MSGSAETPSAGVSQTGEAAQARADLFGELGPVHADDVEAEPKRFGAGRPKGSRNRSSEEISRMIQQIGGHPLLALARVFGAGPAKLRESLGVNRERAFELWKEIGLDLAPYVASKMPLAVAVSGKVVSLGFTMQAGNGAPMLGPDAVAALFAAGAARAEAEGFEIPALIENGNGDETDT